MTTRRRFLTTFLAAAATPRLTWASVGSPSYIAAAKEGDDYALFGLTPEGAITFRVPLPARGHAGAGHPTQPIAVAFARRPGNYAILIDCVSGSILQHLHAPEGNHFNGHGLYVDNGRILITTEQRSSDSAGRLGLWDAENGYSRLGEMDTYGVGPHDVRLMPDMLTLVVANGGIQTDPGGRTPLNVGAMQPNLVYLTLDGVEEIVKLEADLHFNSIRHLAVRDDGLVAFAMQWQDDPSYLPPLLGLHRRGSDPILAQAPLSDEYPMQGYAGSIAFAPDGSEVAISSPKGGRLHRFDENGAFLGAVIQPDVCGLVAGTDGYLSSDGFGNIAAVRDGITTQISHHPVNWDNHIIAL